MAGFAISVVSLLVAIGYLVAKLMFWDELQLGLAPLLIGIYFFGAVQLFFIGVLGEYIGAIHTQVHKRPLVVEKERINFDRPTNVLTFSPSDDEDPAPLRELVGGPPGPECLRLGDVLGKKQRPIVEGQNDRESRPGTLLVMPHGFDHRLFVEVIDVSRRRQRRDEHPSAEFVQLGPVEPSARAGDEAGEDHAQDDGLTVRDRKVRRRFDGVTEAMSEVQQPPRALVELVFLDVSLFDSQRFLDGFGSRRAGSRRHNAPIRDSIRARSDGPPAMCIFTISPSH